MFKCFGKAFLMLAVIGPVIGFMLAAIISYEMPKKYESEAIIEVKPRVLYMPSTAPRGNDAPPPQTNSITPQFFGTEFEIIKSRNSLERVVDNLELVSRWCVDKETAIRILKGIVTCNRIRESDLISIRVRHTNRQDAKDVAEEIAKAYKAYRQEAESRDFERGGA